MKQLGFKPHKSKESFRKNYKLHDLAEEKGINLLLQWGIDYKSFGSDKRYQPVWEEGKDKPDLLIDIGGKEAFIDWKAKTGTKWLMNKRAADGYTLWSKEKKVPVIIVFFVFDDSDNIIERRFARLDYHDHQISSSKQWDKNTTIEFTGELPVFNKPNLIEIIKKKGEN